VSVEQGLAVCVPWNSGALAPRSKDFEMALQPLTLT
jgi:hypothetical protein